MAIAIVGEGGLDYAIGQRIDQPVYAKVAFQVPDPKRTAAEREAARAKIPSYYTPNDPALTLDRIRADLMRWYQIATDAATFEDYVKALEPLKWPTERPAYDRLREFADLPGEAGRSRFQEIISKLPIENQYVVAELSRENRTPPSTLDYILLESKTAEPSTEPMQVANSELVPWGSPKALEGVASHVARRLTEPKLRATVEVIISTVFHDQPTILFDRERTVAAMKKAEDATPEAMTTYEAGKPFINPGFLGPEGYELLRAHQAAYGQFLQQDTAQAAALRQERLLQRIGLGMLVGVITIGLLGYTRIYEPRILNAPGPSVRFGVVILGTLAVARAMDFNWPQFPELTLGPCLVAGGTLAIAHPRRFAIGAMCIVAVLMRTMLHTHLEILLVLATGIAATIYQLDEIRSRAKLPVTGLTAGIAVMLVSAAGSLWAGQELDFLTRHAFWAGGSALLAAFVLSGLLPFLERAFRVATSLTLLEWRDPTRPLLQLLAREAPGTYNHSLVLGTLAEAACERIGANGLLAQVGALYHDVGKIHRAAYFAENQEGRISRHENLSPTMSLLIILGHVKDGLEMAKQYRLPPVLHQFIAEHHGTTVVRYFHNRAAENQPRIATGRHDRAVSEADFRYGGPKPRSRETAVLMLCDGVEGAVRALSEATVGRIEGTVHQLVMDRLNDGQFDDCDITMRDIRLVEESLVKTLCGIYHGRVAYPKARKGAEESLPPARLSV